MPELVCESVLLVAPPDDLNQVHELLLDVWRQAPEVPETDRVCFETALIELAANVLRHAAGYDGVTCRLSVDVTATAIEATLSDTGEPGHIDLALRPMPDTHAESGRGIPLIHALVDEVHYTRADDRNHWRIARRLTA